MNERLVLVLVCVLACGGDPLTPEERVVQLQEVDDSCQSTTLEKCRDRHECQLIPGVSLEVGRRCLGERTVVACRAAAQRCEPMASIYRVPVPEAREEQPGWLADVSCETDYAAVFPRVPPQEASWPACSEGAPGTDLCDVTPHDKCAQNPRCVIIDGFRIIETSSCLGEQEFVGCRPRDRACLQGESVYAQLPNHTPVGPKFKFPGGCAPARWQRIAPVGVDWAACSSHPDRSTCNHRFDHLEECAAGGLCTEVRGRGVDRARRCLEDFPVACNPVQPACPTAPAVLNDGYGAEYVVDTACVSDDRTTQDEAVDWPRCK